MDQSQKRACIGHILTQQVQKMDPPVRLGSINPEITDEASASCRKRTRHLDGSQRMRLISEAVSPSCTNPREIVYTAHEIFSTQNVADGHPYCFANTFGVGKDQKSLRLACQAQSVKR
jgi:hypothetical protein